METTEDGSDPIGNTNRTYISRAIFPGPAVKQPIFESLSKYLSVLNYSRLIGIQPNISGSGQIGTSQKAPGYPSEVYLGGVVI